MIEKMATIIANFPVLMRVAHVELGISCYFCKQNHEMMTIQEAMKERHSVRTYLDRPIPAEILAPLRALMEECNEKGNLHIQLVLDDPKAFDSRLAHYGHFAGVRNYFALVGSKGGDLDERLGYWGEHLVLKAQMLGLNTCWVGLTYRKNAAVLNIGAGERLRAVIAVGYGANNGVPHKVKSLEKLGRLNPVALAKHAEMPQWFINGVKAAQLAPTAMNQQKFQFTLWREKAVLAQTSWGFFAKMDLGIAKYHFELGAGSDCFFWCEI